MRGNGALQKYYLNRNTKATPQDISQKCKTSSVPNTDLIHTGVWQEILLSNFGKKIGVLLAISWLSWALIGPSSNFPSFSLISPISQKSTELLDMSILPKTFHKGIFFFFIICLPSWSSGTLQSQGGFQLLGNLADSEQRQRDWGATG